MTVQLFRINPLTIYLKCLKRKVQLLNSCNLNTCEYQCQIKTCLMTAMLRLTCLLISTVILFCISVAAVCVFLIFFPHQPLVGQLTNSHIFPSAISLRKNNDSKIFGNNLTDRFVRMQNGSGDYVKEINTSEAANVSFKNTALVSKQEITENYKADENPNHHLIAKQHGSDTDFTCSHGFYGRQCLPCKCNDHQICNKLDGLCTCKEGRTGTLCEIPLNSIVKPSRGDFALQWK
ncbi:hypothetical protein GJ496_011832 [Pomphorhynchus laevis]|nr:hypothetical protein GJ496_011832 [Pomphorhynchus laevis]